MVNFCGWSRSKVKASLNHTGLQYFIRRVGGFIFLLLMFCSYETGCENGNIIQNKTRVSFTAAHQWPCWLDQRPRPRAARSRPEQGKDAEGVNKKILIPFMGAFVAPAVVYAPFWQCRGSRRRRWRARLLCNTSPGASWWSPRCRPSARWSRRASSASWPWSLLWHRRTAAGRVCRSSAKEDVL